MNEIIEAGAKAFHEAQAGDPPRTRDEAFRQGLRAALLAAGMEGPGEDGFPRDLQSGAASERLRQAAWPEGWAKGVGE